MINNSGLYMARKRSRPLPTGYTPAQLEQRRARKRYEKARLARANFIPMPRIGKTKVPKPFGVAFFTKRWTAARYPDAKKAFNIPDDHTNPLDREAWNEWKKEMMQ